MTSPLVFPRRWLFFIAAAVATTGLVVRAVGLMALRQTYFSDVPHSYTHSYTADMVLSLTAGASAIIGTIVYGSFIYAVAWWMRPRTRPVVLFAVAVAFCWTVETLQLTGVPDYLAGGSQLATLALGSHFDWYDMAVYPAGAAVFLAGHTVAAELRKHVYGMRTAAAAGS